MKIFSRTFSEYFFSASVVQKTKKLCYLHYIHKHRGNIVLKARLIPFLRRYKTFHNTCSFNNAFKMALENASKFFGVFFFGGTGKNINRKEKLKWEISYCCCIKRVILRNVLYDPSLKISEIQAQGGGSKGNMGKKWLDTFLHMGNL